VYCVAVFAVGAIGQLGHSIVLVTMAIFAAGFCIVGGQIAANALACDVLSDLGEGDGRRLGARDRARGSIVGPLVGGVLLTMKWSTAFGVRGGRGRRHVRALAAFS